MAVLKKGMGPIQKNFIFKNKIETDIPNKKKWWDPRILFYKHENSFAKVCTKQALIFSALTKFQYQLKAH